MKADTHVAIQGVCAWPNLQKLAALCHLHVELTRHKHLCAVPERPWFVVLAAQSKELSWWFDRKDINPKSIYDVVLSSTSPSI